MVSAEHETCPLRHSTLLAAERCALQWEQGDRKECWQVDGPSSPLGAVWSVLSLGSCAASFQQLIIHVSPASSICIGLLDAPGRPSREHVGATFTCRCMRQKTPACPQGDVPGSCTCWAQGCHPGGAVQPHTSQDVCLVSKQVCGHLQRQCQPSAHLLTTAADWIDAVRCLAMDSAM